jgi:hypothetical protein
MGSPFKGFLPFNRLSLHFAWDVNPNRGSAESKAEVSKLVI